MRIVQVCPRYYPYIGGVENHVKNISQKLTERGHEIQIVTTDPSGKLPRTEEIEGVKVHRFPVFAPNQTIFFSKELHKALKNIETDIIHSHGYQSLPMLSAAFSMPGNKAQLVVSLHLGFSKIGNWIYKFYNPTCGRYIFKKAKKIILVSPASISTMPILSDYKEKIEYVANGVNISKIDHYRKKYMGTADDGMLRIISVGRLEKKKGLNYLIQALNSMDDLRFHLSIVGDGPYKDKLLKVLSSSKCKSQIEFLGYVDEEELYKIYAQSDVFTLLSEYESHSIALTEAMGFGVVPIATRVGGNEGIITDEYDGFLLRYPIIPSELIGLLRHVSKNKEVLRTMSQSAQKTVKERFNLEGGVRNLEQIYTEHVLN